MIHHLREPSLFLKITYRFTLPKDQTFQYLFLQILLQDFSSIPLTII